MTYIFAFGIAAVLLYFAYTRGYKSGNRTGSRKGYGVGRQHERRSRSKSGCMVVLAVLFALATTSLVVFI